MTHNTFFLLTGSIKDDSARVNVLQPHCGSRQGPAHWYIGCLPRLRRRLGSSSSRVEVDAVMGFRAAHLSSNDRSRSAIPPSALPWQLVVRTPRTCHPWMSSNQVAHVMCSGRFELEIPTGWSSGLFSVWSSCWVVSFRTCLRNILDSYG